MVIKKRKKLTKQAGFTLVEVGIVVPMALLVLGVIFSYLITTYLEGLQQTSQLAVMDDVNSSINRINDDLMVAAGVQSNISSYLTDAYAPAGGWNANTGTASSPVAIVQALATTAPSKNAAKKVVRLQRSGSDCSADKEITNPILYYNIIYFVSGGNLYKRTLANNTDSSGLPACDTPFQQKQTCPAGVSNPVCNGTDILVASDVSNFRVIYGEPYTAFCDSSFETLACDVTIPEEASVIAFELTITRSVAAEPFSFTAKTAFAPINL